MLDKQTEMMLQVANALTAEDLDALRGEAIARPPLKRVAVPEHELASEQTPTATQQMEPEREAVSEPAVHTAPQGARSNRTACSASTAGLARGEYERQRTRESKISTACVGREREKHDWWPVGTELVGRMGSETFTAMVVENNQVKSGRSILITSGLASGKVCITPTRAAIEATEHHRQANRLGRGGGVTNGWEFWKPRT